jgi:hypothetical protein
MSVNNGFIGPQWSNGVTATTSRVYNLDQNLFPVKLLRDLPRLKASGIFLCGGAALALYLGQKLDTIKDYDFYAKDLLSKAKFEEYLAHELRLHISHVSENATTYSSQYHRSKIQIINRSYFYDYNHVFETFDFGICKVGYDGDNFYFGPNTREQIHKKQLVMEGAATSDFIKRWFKYTLKGYKMDNKVAADIIRNHPNQSLDLSKDTGY